MAKESFSFGFADGEFPDLLEGHMPHPLQRAILPILLKRSGTFEVAGTAFIIGPRLALTATHTLVEGGAPRGDEPYLVFLGGENPDGSLMGGLLPIQKISLSADSDVALLRFDAPVLQNDEPIVRTALPISFLGPVVGDTCIAIGYTAGVTFDEAPAEHPRVVTVNPKLRASRGVIEEIHEQQRDSFFLRFPVFRTNARFDSQMSGSPIFSGPANAKHRVVGVVTTGFDHGTESSAHTSHGSLLWPSAALHLPYLDGEGREREHSLLELAYAKQVDVDSTAELTVDDEWRVTRRFDLSRHVPRAATDDHPVD